MKPRCFDVRQFPPTSSAIIVPKDQSRPLATADGIVKNHSRGVGIQPAILPNEQSGWQAGSQPRVPINLTFRRCHATT